MPAFHFTEHTRRALQTAKAEAAAMRHGAVGTEHVLLAILALEDCKALAMLTTLGLDLARLRTTVRGRVVSGCGDAAALGELQPPDAPLPYSVRCKKVIEFAMLEARDRGQVPVGTEHLLVGLVRERSGVAAKVLMERGVGLRMVRAELDRIEQGGGQL